MYIRKVPRSMPWSYSIPTRAGNNATARPSCSRRIPRLATSTLPLDLSECSANHEIRHSNCLSYFPPNNFYSRSSPGNTIASLGFCTRKQFLQFLDRVFILVPDEFLETHQYRVHNWWELIAWWHMTKALDGPQFLFSEPVREAGNPAEVHCQPLGEDITKLAYVGRVTPWRSRVCRVSKFDEGAPESAFTIVLLGWSYSPHWIHPPFSVRMGQCEQSPWMF